MTSILSKALATDDLDEAVKLIQDALGINTGDVAGVVLSGYGRGFPNEWWHDASVGDRRHALLRLLDYELAYAEVHVPEPLLTPAS
jgi:hypothetical protein